jgi:uncharacterized protein (TIGR00369 family)
MVLGVDEIPQGYAAHCRKSPVTEPWEPLFSRIVEGTVILATRIRQAHCNGKGFLHGGVVSALADNAMGLLLIETLRREGIERGRGGITVNLAVDFLASAQIGQWLEIMPRVLTIGRTIAFTDCLVRADGKHTARANATFRFYRTPPAAAD